MCCISDVLGAYLPSGYRGLEVFARGLVPGWTAWGDQPLLLQRVGGLLGTCQHAGEAQTRGEERAQGGEHAGEAQTRGGEQAQGGEKQELPSVEGRAEREQLCESERAAQPAGCGEAPAGQESAASC